MSSFKKTTKSHQTQENRADSERSTPAPEEYVDSIASFVSTLPSKHQLDILTIINTGNLSIDTKLVYLEDYLTVAQLKECRKLLQEHCSNFKQFLTKQQLTLIDKMLAKKDFDSIKKTINGNTAASDAFQNYLKYNGHEEDGSSSERDEEENDEEEDDEEESDEDEDEEDAMREALDEKDQTIRELLAKIASLELAEKKQELDEMKEKLEEEKKRNNELEKDIKELRKEIEIERESYNQLLSSEKERESLQNKVSPFPFLENESLITVQVPHDAIQKYTKGKAVDTDTVIRYFLTNEKRLVYETWKEELRYGIPTELSRLSGKKKKQIMAYITENYTLKSERNERSLEEIMEIAHKMLDEFEKIKKTPTTTSSEEINVLASLSRKDRQAVFHWVERYYMRNTAIKMKENSLDDILHISQKMLKKFEKDEGCEGEEAGVSSSGEAEMEEVKAVRPQPDSDDQYWLEFEQKMRLRRSPFPFLLEEDDETIAQVHGTIRKFVSKTDFMEKTAVNLSEENQKRYEVFKEELRREIPIEIACLPTELKKPILNWVHDAFPPPKPGRGKAIRSLEEILKIAQEMLLKYEQYKRDHPDEPTIGFIGEQNQGESTQKEEEGEGKRRSSAVEFEKIERPNDDAKPDNEASPPLHERRISPPEEKILQANLSLNPPVESSDNLGGGSLSNNNGYVTPHSTIPPEPLRQQSPTRDDNQYWLELKRQKQEAQKHLSAQKVAKTVAEDYNPNKSLSAPPLPPREQTKFVDYGNSLNVVLIGATGVGKTTFINGFQNYLKYESLGEALQAGPLVPIRTSFQTTLEDGPKPIDYKVEPPYNAVEYTNEPLFPEKGHSRTQNAMIHEFPYTYLGEKRTIRLVDTPGTMDTRGEAKDKENYYNTIEVLSKLKHIHAICVLLKPNEARFDQDFSRALDFLFVYLPKTAVQSVVFCFTSTEPFNFLPGESLPVLENYLNKLETSGKIKIAATQDNMFCFDNNSFRFQCMVHQYPKYADKIREYEKSWNNNKKQLQRMLGYIQYKTPYSTIELVEIGRVEHRLQRLVDTFVAITKEHARQVNALKALSKSPFKPKEVEERDHAFKYIIRCCVFFTEFLQRTSIGVADVFGTKLQKLIMDEEKSYSLCKTAEQHSLITRLHRIATSYQTQIITLRSDTLKKGAKKTTVDEIETVLANMTELKYYGAQIDAVDAPFRNPSFRENSVKL